MHDYVHLFVYQFQVPLLISWPNPLLPHNAMPKTLHMILHFIGKGLYSKKGKCFYVSTSSDDVRSDGLSKQKIRKLER